MTDTNSSEPILPSAENFGEMSDADTVGTVGSPDCGDMLRLWIRFREEDGRKVIDRASYQSFGCQTAMAVADLATRLIAGKTAEEALALSSTDLSRPLGPLPPMKIHCGKLVEDALRDALEPRCSAAALSETPASGQTAPTLDDAIPSGTPAAGRRRLRIVRL
ncbi:MAG TPA: iron-sulfur cluster assembly scaffold protein [Verrucomicrobiales bacterium]|nr:iron-sulfur cluster assembly scaffold protein [Verrucomicrobiales bacterium]